MNNYKCVRQILLILIMLGFWLSGVAQLNADRLLTIGKNALYFEDYLLSIQYFNQVIKVKPYLAEPYFFRGLAKFYLEDFQGAEADCSLAIERNPFIVDAYEVRGLSRLSIGDYKAAVDDYNVGLKHLPENKIFLLNRAIALQNMSEISEARETFDLLLEKYPKYDKGYLGRAQLNLAAKDSVAALADADRCIAVNENNVGAYLLRADIRLHLNRSYEDALADVDRAIKLEPKQAGLFINRAYLKYNLDDYFGAMADFDYAIGLEPSNVTAHFNRGLLRMEVMDDNRAIEDFSFVISREPENYMALYNRALLYQRIRQYDRSVADFDRVVGEYPYLPSLYFARSESKRLSGNVKGGERDYNKSRELQKRHEERKHIVPEGKEGGGAAEESPEDVIKRFSSLMVVENGREVKPEYENKYRGKIQNYDIAVGIEGMYVLSYYNQIAELKTDAYYQREIDEINAGNFLRNKLYVTNSDAPLSEEDIEAQFESIRYYSGLLAGGNPSAADYFGRALSYGLLKNYDAAIADLTDAIGLSPHFALAYFARANAKYFGMLAEDASVRDRAGESDESARLTAQISLRSVFADLNKAIELSPNSVCAYFNKGNIYYSQSDYTSAISCYTSAITIKPDFGEAYYNRGVAYLRLGNMDGGMADLSRAGELGIMSSYNVIKRMRKGTTVE